MARSKKKEWGGGRDMRIQLVAILNTVLSPFQLCSLSIVLFLLFKKIKKIFIACVHAIVFE